MTRYDFLCARRMILSHVLTDVNRIYVFVNLSCELGQILTRYLFLRVCTSDFDND